MKANAPEKIYILNHTDYSDKRILNAFTEKEGSEDIEYTRTDAFIEKATEWLNNFYNEDTHSYLIDEDIEKFINYMKGE